MFNSTDEMEVILGVMSGEKLGNVIERQEKRGQINLERSEKLPINRNQYTKKEDPEYKEKLNALGFDVGEDIDDLFMSVKLPEGWSIKGTDHSMYSNLIDGNGNKRASIFYKAAFYDRDASMSFNRRFSVSYKKADYNEEDFHSKPKYIETGKTKTVLVDEDGTEVKGFENMRNDVYYIYEDYDGYEMNSYRNSNKRNGKTVKPVEKPILKINPNYVELTGYEKYSQPFHYEVHDHDDTILFSSDVVKTDYEYSKDNHYEFFKHMEQVEKAASGQCYAWLEENYPDYQNVLAYWD